MLVIDYFFLAVILLHIEKEKRRCFPRVETTTGVYLAQ
jgi:hypothetical protein